MGEFRGLDSLRVGDLSFFDGPCPGNDYLGVTSFDPITASLLQCPAPYTRPLIFGFSNKVSGTDGRMFNAW